MQRVFHASHTFDLKRIIGFNSKKIKEDGIEQLFGITSTSPSYSEVYKIGKILWNRSGEYLKATGDRDLVSRRDLSDEFFLQSADPSKLVDAIYQVRRKPI